MALNVTILDSSITHAFCAAPFHLRSPAGRQLGVFLSSSAGDAACRIRRPLRPDDDAKRRPFISWNGARLFDDTLAALSRPELGWDGKTWRRLRAARGKESVCCRIASSSLTSSSAVGRRENARRYVFTLNVIHNTTSENVQIYNSHKKSPNKHIQHNTAMPFVLNVFNFYMTLNDLNKSLKVIQTDNVILVLFSIIASTKLQSLI